MQLKIALDDKKLDKRLRDRFVSEGTLTSEDEKKYLESLEDDSSNVEVIDAE